jgi:hypothetical protein
VSVTPITKEQWLSVARNTVLAFLATFLPAIVYSPEITQAAVKAAVVAGLMASFKVIEKAFQEA